MSHSSLARGVGQERLGPSYFFISLVLGPLNSLLWYVSARTNKRHHHHQYCGSCPCVIHNPYLPSISASLQTLGRAKRATIHVITPPDSRIVTPLSFDLVSQRLLEVQKFDSERYHQSSHPHWDLVRTHKSRPLSPFHPHLVTSS